MGWGGGGRIVCDMIPAIADLVDGHRTRVEIYKHLIVALEGEDWDDKSECIGISSAFDEALEEIDPGWFEDLDYD